MGVHYLSDVAAGALVGIAAVFFTWSISPGIFEAINQFLLSTSGLHLW